MSKLLERIQALATCARCGHRFPVNTMAEIWEENGKRVLVCADCLFRKESGK